MVILGDTVFSESVSGDTTFIIVLHLQGSLKSRDRTDAEGK